MTAWRVGRTRNGDIRLEMRGARDVWYGFPVTEDDARALAAALMAAMTLTASDLTADKDTEP